jgi:hypothetical protein
MTRRDTAGGGGPYAAAADGAAPEPDAILLEKQVGPDHMFLWNFLYFEFRIPGQHAENSSKCSLKEVPAYLVRPWKQGTVEAVAMSPAGGVGAGPGGGRGGAARVAIAAGNVVHVVGTADCRCLFILAWEVVDNKHSTDGSSTNRARSFVCAFTTNMRARMSESLVPPYTRRRISLSLIHPDLF